MRIFVFESVCGGDLAPYPGATLSRSLVAEGSEMLRSIVEEFAAVQGVERVTTVVGAEFRDLIGTGGPRVIVEVSEGPDLDAQFDACATRADAVLVIAPESDGVLDRRLRRLEDVGALSLGSSAAAAAIAGDKLQLASLLDRREVPTPKALSIDPINPPASSALDFPAVLKPRDGAGSEWTFRLSGEGEFERALRILRAGEIRREMVLSPFIDGVVASAHFIVGDGRCAQLAAGYQLVDDGFEIRYQGGRLPLPSPLMKRATQLGKQTIACIPGLRGFVGVDLVLGQDASDDRVIEVNPRVTTSAIALRRFHAPWSIGAYWLAACGVVPNACVETGEMTIAPCPPTRSVKFSVDEF